MTVRVILPLPVDRAFTYSVPADEKRAARTGCRVLVPFGKRRLTGVIVGEGKPPEKLEFDVKPLLEILDEQPALTGEMLWLTRWIADYYLCSWGEAAKAALPAGTSVRSVRRLERTDAKVADWNGSSVQQELLADVAEHEETTWRAARKRLQADVALSDARALEDAGLIEITTEIANPDVKPQTERHLRFAPPYRHDGVARELKQDLRGHKQQAVIETMAGFRAQGITTPLAEAVREHADASRSTVRSLIDKGMLEVVHRETRRSALDDLPPPGDPPDHELHPAQADALQQILNAIQNDTYASFLLHGVTGSGKTEVYIAALKAVIERGKTGIILVPEIALTPQTVQRFRAHFEGEIAVLHSQMSQGERYDAWRGLREGRFSIAIGPRSAVLAPLENIGLIVVDEEHESTYKQFDPAPRYHARDVAVMRAHHADAVCVLGSATPGLESIHNVKQGKYELLSMPDRVPVKGHDAAPLPEVEIIDLTKERKKGQLDGDLSKPLREAIDERLARGEQTILLHNRRGYASIVECESCGHAPECPDCSVSLTYHKSKNQLRCHYCGFARSLPRVCPECDEPALEQLGSGTQRVQAELNHHFPEATVLRMDRDTTSQKNAHHRILHQFGEGDADILLGTQMVAKGLDFSQVTLVGVVNTDVGLLLPDFRAEERTFQLLMQVAGRAGRDELRGEVLLQTRNPRHVVLQCAAEHNYEEFVEAALADRKTLGYPPYGRIVGVEFKGPKRSKVQDMASEWTSILRQQLTAQVEVLGPEPPVIEKLKRHFRYQTIVRSPLRVPMSLVQDGIRQANDAYGSPSRGYHIAVDVDAVGLL